jgi:hypothetical protein
MTRGERGMRNILLVREVVKGKRKAQVGFSELLCPLYDL